MSNNKQSSVNMEFVPYKEALALKKLGFDEPCLAAYFVFGDGRLINGYYGQTEPELFIHGIGKELEDRMEELKMFAYCATLVPTFSQAFRWFREKYGMIFTLIASSYYYPSVSFINTDGNSEIELGEFATYEEAELACLRKLIDCRIVKNKYNVGDSH